MSNEFIDEGVFEEDTLNDKYLTFLLGEEEFGIEIKYVLEIIKIQAITDMPEVENYVKGYVDLRGNIIQVNDMRLMLGKEEKEYDDKTCIIVMDIDGHTVGFIVDSVSEVLSISKDNLNQPASINGREHRFIKSIARINETIKLIIDCKQLVI